MAVVMQDKFTGTVGASFTGDSVYSNVAGTPPTYQAAANGLTALRFPAAAQSIIGESFTATTVRTFSRVYKLSAAPTANVEVLQTRSAAARGPTLSFSSANHLRIVTGTAAVFLVTGTANLPIGTEFRVTFTVNGAALTATVFADTTTTTPLETISGTDPNGVTTMVSARDGFMAATGAGTGVTMDLTWPMDADNTTDPGPRAYSTLASVTSTRTTAWTINAATSLIMSDNFTGTLGTAFAGDSTYSNIAGTPPSYVAAVNGKALRFSAAAQSIIGYTFTTATTTRYYSRIYRLSGPATAVCEVAQARVGASRGPALAFTDTNTMRVLKTDGTSASSGTAQLPVGTEFRVTLAVTPTTVTATLYPNITSTTPTETISGPLAAATSMSSFRDGIVTAGALGAGVTLDLSWPQDDTTGDPGPRSYPAGTVEPPVPSAGTPLTGLEPSKTVTLAGSEIAGTNPVTARSWTQTGGSPTVTLTGSGATRTYRAPATLAGTTLTFQYAVTTSDGTQTATVTHAIRGVGEQYRGASANGPLLLTTP